MNSRFSSIGSLIERKAMFMLHAVQGQPGHRVNMEHVRKTCDTYVVERLCKGAQLADASREVERVFAAMLPASTFLKMVSFIEGCDVLTAIQKLDLLYNLKEPEARLALMLLQLCTTRAITTPPNTIDVTIINEVLEPA